VSCVNCRWSHPLALACSWTTLNASNYVSNLTWHLKEGSIPALPPPVYAIGERSSEQSFIKETQGRGLSMELSCTDCAGHAAIIMQVVSITICPT
jgi:hypothetical protein